MFPDVGDFTEIDCLCKFKNFPCKQPQTAKIIYDVIYIKKYFCLCNFLKCILFAGWPSFSSDKKQQQWQWIITPPFTGMLFTQRTNPPKYQLPVMGWQFFGLIYCRKVVPNKKGKKKKQNTTVQSCRMWHCIEIAEQLEAKGVKKKLSAEKKRIALPRNNPRGCLCKQLNK